MLTERLAEEVDRAPAGIAELGRRRADTDP
jgi:hypothetical protein